VVYCTIGFYFPIVPLYLHSVQMHSVESWYYSDSDIVLSLLSTWGKGVVSTVTGRRGLHKIHPSFTTIKEDFYPTIQSNPIPSLPS
jgi:hypothetical protein